MHRNPCERCSQNRHFISNIHPYIPASLILQTVFIFIFESVARRDFRRQMKIMQLSVISAVKRRRLNDTRGWPPLLQGIIINQHSIYRSLSCSGPTQQKITWNTLKTCSISFLPVLIYDIKAWFTSSFTEKQWREIKAMIVNLHAGTRCGSASDKYHMFMKESLQDPRGS